MEPDDQLDSILDTWQEAFERGTDIPVGELCRDCEGLIPEVARRIELIRRMAGLQPRGDADPTLSGVIAPDTATLSQSGAPEKHSSQVIAAPPGYEILDEIGLGGMGVVYKARQLSLNRVVALKMVLGGARAKPADLIRFRTEGEAVARLTHPNVVQVHEVGTHDGSPYLTLEYCERGSLDELLLESPLEPRRAAELMLALAQAVHAAHQAGIVHRDLKPANILLTADGTPKVSDFGLAKWADAGDGLTVTGAVVGTPSYMAPEQASGNMKALDRRADVYALGAILYACLTGRPPFKGATPLDTLDQVRSTEPARVRDLQPGVPRDLETICLKCLQKGSDRRYISAAALADDLQRFLDRRPIQARPVGSFERSWRWCRRNPAVALLLTAVLLTSLTGTGVAVWYADSADHRRREAETEKKKADDASQAAQAEKHEADIARGIALKEKSQADEARKDALQKKAEADNAKGEAVRAQRRAEWAAFISQISLSHREWELGNAPAAFQILEATNPELRGWEYAYLRRLYARDQQWSGKHAGMVGAVAISPDGSRVATVGNTELVAWEAATGKEAFRIRTGGRVIRNLVYSPDGKVIVTAEGWTEAKADVQIRRWDARSGEPAGAPITVRGDVKDMWFRGDDQLVVATADGHLRWIVFRTGVELWSVDTGYNWSISAAPSPDRKTLAVGGSRFPVRLFNGETGEPGRAFEKPAGSDAWPDLWRLAFSPDGARVAGVGQGLFVWDVKTGKNLVTIPDALPNGTRAVWVPDGSALVTASEDRTVSVWDAGTGRRLRRYLGHLAPVYGLAASKDTLFSGDTEGRVISWLGSLPPNPQTLRSPGQGWFGDVRFLTGKKAILSVEAGAPAPAVRLWDPAAGQPLRTFAGHTGYISALAISRDESLAFTSSQDGTARMWNVGTGECSALLRHRAAVNGVAVPPGAEWVATSCEDGRIRVWDPTKGGAVRTLFQGDAPASRVATDPDGRLLAAGFIDGLIVVWDTATWAELHRFRHGSVRARTNHPCLALAFTPDRRCLVAGGTNNRLCVWDLTSGKVLWSLESGPAPVLAIAVLPGGNQFVTGMGTWATPGEVKVWNTRTGENTFTLRGFGRECCAVAVDPIDGAVAACSHEGVIRIWGNRATEPAAVQTDWHRTQWRQAEKKADWAAAAFHLSLLATSTPEQPALALRAAHLWKLAGRPEQAALYATWAYLQHPTLPASPARLAFPEGPGRWRIDGEEVVQEAKAQNCWLLFGDPDWTDYDVEVQVKLIEGREGPCIGFRMATSRTDCYLAAAGAWGNTASGIFGEVGGRSFNVTDKRPLTLEVDRWYHVKVEVRGDRFRLLLDGREIHTGTDGTHARGMVGLRSWNAVNRFRNIKVTAPDGKVLFEGLPYLTTATDPTIPITPSGSKAQQPSPLKAPSNAATAESQIARANSLVKSNDLDGALAAAREAVRLAPQNSMTHHTLGHVLWTRGELDEAVAAFRAGLALPSAEAQERICLGRVLQARGDWAEAVDVLDAASRLNPPPANAHRYLGLALVAAGQPDRAVTACREAVRRAEQDAHAHAALGLALRAQGKLPDAIDSLKAALKLNPKSIEFQRHLRLTERWAAFDVRLAKLRDGTDKPATPTEAVEIAFFCQQPFRKQFDLASWLYRGAFAADPKLLSQGAWRYNAACAAVQLAAGSDPTAHIGVDEWNLLQAQARAWLAADLATYARLVSDATPAERAAIRQTLSRWLRDPDLLPARDMTALAAMPVTERVAWEKLWAEVTTVIESTLPAVAPPPHAVARPFPPLDPACLEKVRDCPPRQQVQAVSKEFQRRNPGFDGKLAFHEPDGVVRPHGSPLGNGT